MDFTELKNSLSLEETNERIRQIEDRLHRSLSHNSSRFHTDQNGVSEDQHSAYDASRPENNGPSSFDWTRIYAYSEKYEDIEALRAEVSSEERKARETAEKALLSSAHSHDHAEERAMFELPEQDKMRRCESHRLLGNLLFSEGRHMAPKAAEQYKLAIAYYDYCFPETEEEQARLNTVKYASYCNLSLCYLLMGFYNDAVDSATRAIGKTPSEAAVSANSASASGSICWEVTSKAYYRRAQALRKMHRFEEAARDLQMALRLNTSDGALIAEIASLKAQTGRYHHRSKEVASKMLKSEAIHVSINSHSFDNPAAQSSKALRGSSGLGDIISLEMTSSSSKTFARLTPAHAASHSKSRSITEKLRSNHIDLLEYAERLTVENTKLRGRLCEILKLSENCDDATTDLLLGLSNPSESSDNEASNAGSLFEPQIKELREQVEALQSQLRKLEAENKTLRAKASIQRPPASAEKNDGAVLAIDDSTREGELQDSEKNENNRAGASKIKDLTQRLLDAELELQDSRSELSAWITKCCNMQDDMNKMKLQAEVDLAALEMRINATQSQDSKLLQEMDALREFHEASMQAMVGSFKREMERQLEKEAQIITKKDDLINKQKDELNFTRGELANITIREFELREALDVAKKEVSQLQQHLQSAVNSKSFECVSCSNQAADLPSGATATSASPDEDDAMEGFTFPEYLRLKRENKALKHEINRLNKMRLGTTNNFLNNQSRSKKI